MNSEADISEIKIEIITPDYMYALFPVNPLCACEGSLSPVLEWRTPPLTIESTI